MSALHRRSSDTARRPVLLDALAAVATRTVLDRNGDPLSLRAAAADDHPTGVFEGYACLWDVTDAYGTRFAPKTFSLGTPAFDEPYALLSMHDPAAVIGVFTAREDDTGLWIAGGWDPTPEGQAARARAKSGSAPELSVGFAPRMVDPDDEDRFTQALLVETSQITRRMAAVPGAGFAGVRGLPAGHPGADGQIDRSVARADLDGALAALNLAGPVRRRD